MLSLKTPETIQITGYRVLSEERRSSDQVVVTHFARLDADGNEVDRQTIVTSFADAKSLVGSDPFDVSHAAIKASKVGAFTD